MAVSVRNVVLLTLDALRADHCSWLGYDRETTPALASLAADNATFEVAVSPSSHTREALPALLTGRDPVHAVDESYALAVNSVASTLAAEGFTTGGFHSNPYVSRAYGFGEGFDTFDDDLRLGSHRLFGLLQRAVDKLRNRHYATGETINDRALSWLDGVEEPFFLWNHYMDPHGPYAPPDRYQERFHGETVSRRTAQRRYRDAVAVPESITEEQRRELLDCYDGEIRYADDCIGTFLEALGECGLLDETLVVITADHGDAFGEHGFYGHPRALYDELLCVPLIVTGPGVPDVTVDRPVSTLDVVPTILAAVGIGSDDTRGLPLWRAWDADDDQPSEAFASVRGEGEESAVRRFAGRGARWKALVERDVDSGEVLSRKLYDLASDPSETDPLDPAAETPSDATDAMAALESRSERLIGLAAETVADDVDSAIEERLEILGYK